MIGLEYDFERAAEARSAQPLIVNAAGEYLPFPEESFALVLSHEVLEHVQDDRLAVGEMVRCCNPGGSSVFVPNRGYRSKPTASTGMGIPFRQHPPGELPSPPASRPPGAARAHLPAGI